MSETEPTTIRVEYRNWLHGIPPKRIKLDIGEEGKPGWAGENTYAIPQPWQCKPFADGATYGLEIIYSWKTTCIVTADDKGVCHFDGDFKPEIPKYLGEKWSPFASFAPNHFGYVAMVDIKPPPGYGMFLQPHPRAVMDMTGTVPFATPGLLEMDWWPEIFFMVFRAPLPGKQYVFKQGDPIASYLIVPKFIKYDIVPMSQEEETLRAQRQENLENFWHRICTRIFYCKDGEEFFDNKYKYLSNVARRDGLEVVNSYMDNPKLIEHWNTEKLIIDHRPEDQQVCHHAMRPNDGHKFPEEPLDDCHEFPEKPLEGSLDIINELINETTDMDDAALEKLVVAFKKQRRHNRQVRSQKLMEKCDPKLIKFKDPAADVKANIAKVSKQVENPQNKDWVLGHKIERIKKAP